jgi:DNA-binding LacI/PurR family transcriptional regulator
MRAAKESGLWIPDDVSIVGVDNTLKSRENGVDLTTVSVDVEEIGRKALAVRT